MIGDLRDPYFVAHVIDRRFDEYQLAADMGGAGYIFTGEHDADVMHSSATINLNIVHTAYGRNNKRIFLLLVGMYLPGVQPTRPRQSELRGVDVVPSRTGQ